MRFALVITILLTFSAFAQTDVTAESPAQEQMGAPAAGEASMVQEMKPAAKQHKKAKHKKVKAHKAKAKKHAKKKKHKKMM